MKSISKLIVAGLSLAVTLCASAAPTMPMKNSKTRAGVENLGVTAKLPTQAGKQFSALKGRTYVAPVGNEVKRVKTVKRPQTNVLPMLKAPALVPAASADLYGISIYSELPEYPTGIYTLSSTEASNAMELLADFEELEYGTVFGACIGDGKYYINLLETFWGYIFGAYNMVVDLESMEILEFIQQDASDPSLLTKYSTDQTYDQSTDKIYGCFYDESGAAFVLGVQEPGTFETTAIAPLPQMIGVASTKAGVLYGIDTFGDLYQIDKETAELSYVGYTGTVPAYISSATIDPKTNVMYFTVMDDAGNGELYAINIETAESTYLYQFEGNNEVVGLGVPAPQAAEGAPNAVENLDVAFEDDLCTGKISFNMPTTKFDGTPFVGACDYTIVRNGEIIKEGRESAGFAVEYIDVVPARGSYKYQVYASNEAGPGPKSTASLWIGPDAPVAPANVTLEYADGSFNVNWEAVESTLHSGEAPEDVTYRVALCLGGAMVEFVDNVEGTSYSFEGKAPENLSLYYAVVTAVTPRTESQLGVSNTIALGHANTPYVEEFDDVNALAAYTIIDANEDGRTWNMVTPGVLQVIYNSYNDMDDWIITPAIRLEAGKEYTFNMNVASGSSYYFERVEAMVGTAPEIDAMTTVLVDPTDLGLNEFIDLGSSFICEETGDYYFGVHGISDADQLYLYLSSISVSAGVNTDAPVAPELKAVANPSGALDATVTYVAPSTTLNGAETAISKVVVTVDGEVASVNEEVEAGQTYSLVVPVDADGTHVFTAVAYNEAGAGRVATTKIYVGINRPAAPEYAKAYVNAEGDIVVSWEAPTVDIDGYPINPELISYIVVTEDDDVVAYDITETTCTYTPAEVDEQMFTYCTVYAQTEAGLSATGAYSNLVAVGPAYELPVIESFDDGHLAYIMGLDDEGGASWGLYTDEDLITDFDGTNGTLAMSGQYVGEWATVFTGNIKLDAEKPAVALSYYCIANDDENTVDVMVLENGAENPVLVKTLVMGEGTEGAWNPVMVSLEEFAGKTVSVQLRGTVESYAYIILDQLKVYEPREIDLGILNVSAPAMVAPGEEFEVDVKVMNVGIQDVPAYKVELLNNGVVVATADCEAIPMAAIQHVTFTYSYTPVSEVSNILTAKVVADGDLGEDNNVSPEFPVVVDIPNYPKATDLTAVAGTEGVALNWVEPNLDPENMPKVAITDDFESYEPFTYTNIGDWTLVDEDGMVIGGVNGVNFPGIVVGETMCAYFVNNTEELGLTEAANYAAHSGYQYLISTFPYEGAQSLDWLISPALTGDAQTISFYAKSFNADYAETFQVLYSTTDTDIESFVEIVTYENISTDWTRYSVYLPEGAQYFAIRCISYDKFLFFVDDVTYVPANGEPMELSLVGYNIYRNGVKINAEPVAETSYVDAEGSTNDEYQVTVVYAEGESGASNVASVSGNAVDGLNSAVAATAKVSVEHRTIVVTGAEGRVAVYTADGKVLYNAAAESRNAINVVPGVYVVMANKYAQKVVVK